VSATGGTVRRAISSFRRRRLTAEPVRSTWHERCCAPEAEEREMESKKLTRRTMLVVIGATAGLAACGGGGAADCESPPGLTDEQRTQRRNLAYVDRTPSPSQRCEVCNFFTAPAQENACGGCTLNLGAVSPQGYCSSFVARA
jgi:hypothetical protein